MIEAEGRFCTKYTPGTTWVSNTVFNTLWTGDADLRLYITTVQDG